MSALDLCSDIKCTESEVYFYCTVLSVMFSTIGYLSLGWPELFFEGVGKAEQGKEDYHVLKFGFSFPIKMISK